jgi:hypothetical protein
MEYSTDLSELYSWGFSGDPFSGRDPSFSTVAFPHRFQILLPSNIRSLNCLNQCHIPRLTTSQ